MQCKCCPDKPYVAKSARSMRRHKSKMRAAGVEIEKEKTGPKKRLQRGFADRTKAKIFHLERKIKKLAEGLECLKEEVDRATDSEDIE